MKIRLNPLEARIIGVLIEKSITTPDQYPLSLNALTNGCNQKTNRDPVLAVDEATVQQTLDDLKKRFLVSDHAGFGSRVTKYQHRLCNSEFGRLQLTAGELAILCELLLRGPQTAGELRSHGERLHRFRDVAEVESTLTALAQRDEPLVARLPREPGKREARYTHLLGDEPSPAAVAVGPVREETIGIVDVERFRALEAEVGELRAELERLRRIVEATGEE